MNAQLESVGKILSSLEQIESLISSSSPPSSSSPAAMTTPGDEVQRAINNYVSGLKTLNEMGNTSNFPISYDFLQFLETDVTNPWLYMHKQLEECEDIALELAKRKKHIEEIQEKMKTVNSS